jgi:Ca2+-binding RTX toxin-like protein
MKLWVGLILTTMVLGVMLLSGVVLAKKLVGGPGNNNYMGSNDTDYIYGGGGADDIGGKNGPDHLFGDKGNDRLHGGRGHDWVEGGPGSDTAWSDKGTDDLFAEREHKGSFQAAKVKGGRKPNRLLGGRGNDIIRAKNGKKDIIRGGPGYDKAYVDRVDKVKGVEKEVVPGGGGGTGGPQPKKQCADGKDNDGDGKTDLQDPSCASAKDDTEKNQPPVAKKDSYSVVMDRDIKELAPGVLKNDKDVDGDSLTAEVVDPPSCNGFGCGDRFTFEPDGSFIYKSRDDVYTDSFTYKATDGAAGSNLATVTINVICDPNDPLLPPECVP